MPSGENWSSRTHCLAGHLHDGTGSARRTLADGTVKVYRFRRCLQCDRNARRKPRGPRWRRFLEWCPKGHPYAGDNLAVYEWAGREYRRCKACRKVVCARAMRKWRAKIKGGHGEAANAT